MTSEELAELMVLRTWRLPDGPLVARIGTVRDPRTDPACWQTCLGPDRTLLVVRRWLWRCAAEPQTPSRP